MFNQPTNSRRFIGPMGELLGIYDQCRAYTTYAQLEDWGHDAKFIPGTARTYWSDEIREVQ